MRLFLIVSFLITATWCLAFTVGRYVGTSRAVQPCEWTYPVKSSQGQPETWRAL